jgi:3-oxoacyl-[acyl-carrier-protein] synthase-3
VQNKVGAKNAGTFDVDCACAAFPAQVAIAAGLLATNAASGRRRHDSSAQRPNRSGRLPVGRRRRRRGHGGRRPRGLYRGAAFQAHGAYAFGWGIASGGTFEPANIDAVKAGRTQMRREAGNYPASVNEDNWPRLFQRLSTECGFTPEQVDQLIFTQISKPSIAIAAQRCKVPVEKCHTIMDARGYTGSACIPMALDDAVGLRKIKRGDLVVMMSSGLGWNQAAAAVRWTI